MFVGPAAAIASLAARQRRLLVLGIFAYAAGVIFAAAEPFAESLVQTGEDAGIDEFILVQWVAPLASESPEFILAGLLALRGRHDAAMTILISSKVNQWTLLIGSLPLAYSISGTTFDPLDFDSRQSEEVFLTAAQSLFAVAILVSLSINRWEALAGRPISDPVLLHQRDCPVGVRGNVSRTVVHRLCPGRPTARGVRAGSAPDAQGPRRAGRRRQGPDDEVPP